MADLVRKPIPACQWTEYNLRAYNIAIQEDPSSSFLGTENFRLPEVPAHLLDFIEANGVQEAIRDTDYRLLRLLELACNTTGDNQQFSIINFTAQLLREMAFTENRRVILQNHSYPLLVNGRSLTTQVDLIVEDESMLPVLIVCVQKGKPQDLVDAEAQLIASAIAAFQSINRFRQRRSLGNFKSWLIYGITLSETCPTFYKFTITAELSQAVADGKYPPTEVICLRHTLRSSVQCRNGPSLDLIYQRETILRYYEALREQVVVKRRTKFTAKKTRQRRSVEP